MQAIEYERSSKGKYASLMSYIHSGNHNESAAANKVKVAKHYVAENPAPPNNYDLKKVLSKLINFIDDCNL